jgi:hypothetical protein
MKVTIDRFEGKFAVCEKPDRTMINLRKDKIPADAKEGDTLIIEGETIKTDSTTTTKRKSTINNMMDNLWK